LRYRERNIVGNDYLHILMQLKETSKDDDFTDVDVTAHGAGFIADGYGGNEFSLVRTGK
jgi:hypothetical protein